MEILLYILLTLMLAAVAMLVAIFKARPSPFYVMDEVEAALDDANLAAHLVFGVGARHVRHVIAGGRLVVRNRALTTMDEHAFRERARNAAARLWAVMAK